MGETDLIEVGTRALAPYELLGPKRRERCPFYGFHLLADLLIDSEGNQCPLIINRYSPCRMEVQNIKPNWDFCAFNTRETSQRLEEVSDSIKVFPKESRVSGGIPFKHWKDFVMS